MRGWRDRPPFCLGTTLHSPNSLPGPDLGGEVALSGYGESLPVRMAVSVGMSREDGLQAQEGGLVPSTAESKRTY